MVTARTYFKIRIINIGYFNQRIEIASFKTNYFAG